MRALMLDPPVLLMDEPLGALDPVTRHSLQRDLKSIFSRLARTVVLVTHDMHEAAHFADEIVLMREGRVVQRGTLDDLLARPAEPFVTEFIRRAARRSSRLAAAAGAMLQTRRAADGRQAQRRRCQVPDSFAPRVSASKVVGFFASYYSAVSAHVTAASADELVIGSKRFTESYILGEIAAQTRPGGQASRQCTAGPGQHGHLVRSAQGRKHRSLSGLHRHGRARAAEDPRRRISLRSIVDLQPLGLGVAVQARLQQHLRAGPARREGASAGREDDWRSGAASRAALGPVARVPSAQRRLARA